MRADFHTQNAAKMFGVPISQVTAEQRQASKTYMYGAAYGQFGKIKFFN